MNETERKFSGLGSHVYSSEGGLRLLEVYYITK